MINTILILLGIIDPTEQVENQVEAIANITSQRLKIMINRTEVPSELEYIVVEVSVKRYNRLGSEGVSRHSVEGESMYWDDADFDDYMDDINTWIEVNDEETVGRGDIKFL